MAEGVYQATDMSFTGMMVVTARQGEDDGRE